MLNPVNAERLGIAERDMVEVTSRVGRLVNDYLSRIKMHYSEVP
ncbi:MAG: hypothetical protein COA68_13040 [Oceanobacter sp.]|nr:MAG: hypothetical protein COA68_13040 [Oceanobacter sp.]